MSPCGRMALHRHDSRRIRPAATVVLRLICAGSRLPRRIRPESASSLDSCVRRFSIFSAGDRPVCELCGSVLRTGRSFLWAAAGRSGLSMAPYFDAGASLPGWPEALSACMKSSLYWSQRSSMRSRWGIMPAYIFSVRCRRLRVMRSSGRRRNRNSSRRRNFRGFEFAPCVLFPEGNVVQTENHPAPGPAFDLCERNGIYALDDDAIYALLLERPAKEIDVRRFFRIGSGRQLPELKYCPLFIT